MGLGYVGLTLASTLADVGFNVCGVEIRDNVLAMLEKGEAHFHEPGLNEQLHKVIGLGTFKAHKHIPAGRRNTVYIITVGTPLGSNGRSRMDIMENVGREVAEHLKDGDLVIMRSTVMIGTTRDFVVPILNKAGVQYDLAFCPERTLEGQALPELRRLPQIVGGLTPEANIRAAQLFQFVTPTVVRVNDVETAEMIKLVDNAQRDVQFAYANEIARLCDKVGISATEVISAGKLGYPRTNLPAPGPVGGHCLEKDPYILAEGLEKFGITPEITLTSRKVNERQIGEVVDHLKQTASSFATFPPNPIITIAGIAFKGRPATDDLRGTMAIPLIKAIAEAFPGAKLRGYDAVVPPEQIKSLDLEPVSTLEQAFSGSNLLIIQNNHPCFANMPVERLASAMAKPGIVYDFWNHFSARELHMPHGTGYMALGSHAWFTLQENPS
jgi:nucleotide sugar dehydrogenase